MSLFPVPVSGQQIPRGWFARLVRFMNSLFLRGDGSYLAVSHTPEGTFIRPTPYLIDQLNKAASAPASGGGTNQDISASVSGGTASVTLSGSTSAVEFVGTGDVTISGNTNGQIEINVSGGTAGGMPWPDWDSLVGHQISLSWTSGSPMVASYIVPQNAWLKLDFAPVFNLNSAAGYHGHIILDVDADGEEIYRYDKYVETENTKLYIDDSHTQMIAVKAGALLSFAYTGSGAGDLTPSLSVYLYY